MVALGSRSNAVIGAQAAVIGGGPAGLVAALALAHFRVPTVLVARRQLTTEVGAPGTERNAPSPSTRPNALPRANGYTNRSSDLHSPTSESRAPSSGFHHRSSDNRTTALIGTSVAALETLGVWERCRVAAAPLRVLRLVDDTARLLRAPEVRFEASEIGLPSFGWNIENIKLLGALWDHAAHVPGLDHIDGEAEAIEIGDDGVHVMIAGRTPLFCRLVVGADGRHSMCRGSAGIAFDSRAIAQTALTFTLRHTRPHGDVSTEFHTAQGPFTLVPLPDGRLVRDGGPRSSLVCVLEGRQAHRLAALSGNALDLEIERRAHSILGKVQVDPGRGAFAMRVAKARRLAANRVALVGEAAHVFPPIGAQGLNLGLRDAATIAEIAGSINHTGGDIGGAAAMAEYESRRRPDVASRSLAVDFLNRSLLSDFLPVQALRGLGLYALGQIGPLRRAAMREGVAPSAATPALMRASGSLHAT